jgi:hypothetical protein
MEMLHQEVLQSLALSATAKKTVKGVPVRKSKEVQRPILSKDGEWQARFKEFTKQVAKLSKAAGLDAQCIMEGRTRIAIRPSTRLPTREKMAEGTPPDPPPSPLTSGHCDGDSSPSLPTENKEEEDGQSPPPGR